VVLAKAEEIAAARRPALADPELLRQPTDADREVYARRLPQLRAQIAQLAARRSLRNSE